MGHRASIPVENFDEDEVALTLSNFEDNSYQNGIRYWYDTDLMLMLGYTDMQSFNKVVQKAISACATLEVDPYDDFIQHPHTNPGNGLSGRYRLSRFALLLITQNANSKKREVKIAQYMLAKMADTLLAERDVERLETRHKLSDGETEMSGIAKSHGIGQGQYDYANFKNAGYKGLYNMSLKELERHKGFKRKSNLKLYDRMSNAELAANLFRVTQTSEYIKNNNIRGQHALEDAAGLIGKKVRTAMETPPEDMALEPTTITEVKKIGKTAAKNMKQIDAKEKKRSK